MNNISELNVRVTEAIFVAEEKTRDAAKAWDRVVELEAELAELFEDGTEERENASRRVMSAKQAANRVWLALGSNVDDDEETPETDPVPKGN